MASIEVNNNKKLYTTPTTSKVGVGEVAVKKPIDFTQAKLKNKELNPEVIKYVNSPEFSKLSAEEQVNQLQAKFLPNATREEVLQYLSAVKTVVAEEVAATNSEEINTDTETNPQPEVGVAGNENSEKAEVKTTEEAQINNSKLEVDESLEAKIENLGLDAKTIDDAYSKLLLLKRTGKITEEQLKVLEKIDANNTSTSVKEKNAEISKSANTNSNKNVKIDTFVPLKNIISEDFMKSSPEQKFSVLVDSYLSKTNKDYENMSDKEKQKLQSDLNKEFAEILNPEGKKLTIAERRVLAKDMFLLMQDSYENNVPLSEFKNVPQAELKKKLSDIGVQQLNKMTSLVSLDSLKDKAPEEKAYAYINVLLSISDENFNKLDPKQQEIYAKQKVDGFISNVLNHKDWENKTPAEKNKVVEVMFNALENAVKSGTDLAKISEEVSKISTASQLEKAVMFDKLLEGDNSSEAKELRNLNSSKILLLKECRNRGIEENNGNLYKIAQELNETGKLPKNFNQELLKELKANTDIGNTSSSSAIDNDSKTVKLLLGDEKSLAARLDNISKLKPEEQKDRIISVLKEVSTGKELAEIQAKLKSEGLTDKAIKKIIPAELYADLQARGMAKSEGLLTAKATDLAMQTGDVKALKVSKKVMQKSSEYFNAKELSVVGETAVKHKPLVKPFTESINNRKYITKEDAALVATNIAKSENVANAHKAEFAREFITTAAKNGSDEQIYFAKELSKVENPAVTEGLAAASNSVAKNARQQYEDVIEIAMENYPPETKSAIREAMETGEISSKTLSQMTVESSQNTSSETSSKVEGNQNSRETRETKSAESNLAKRNSERNDFVTSQRGKAERITPLQTQRRKVNSSTGMNNDSVQVERKNNRSKTINTVPATETEALEQKKEDLLNKILAYEQEKADKAKERELSKVDQEEMALTEKAETSEETELLSETSDLVITESEREVLKEVIKEIFNENSVSSAFEKIVAKFGDNAKEKFIEIFASKGRESDVLSFANNHKGSPETLIKLITYTNSESLKLDILKMLPSSKVSSLISAGKISTKNITKLLREDKVAPNVFLDYIKNNKFMLSPEQIKDFANLLPLAYRNELFALLKNIPGSDEWQLAQQNNMKSFETTEEYSEVANNDERNGYMTMNDGLASGSNKVPMGRNYDKMKYKGPFYYKA